MQQGSLHIGHTAPSGYALLERFPRFACGLIGFHRNNS